MKEGAKESFAYHMSVIKEHLYEPKTITSGGLNEKKSKVIDPPLSYKQLMDEQSFLNLMMQVGAAKVLAK